MEFDVYNLSSALGEVADLAREVEELGFSGIWFTESKHNPFLGCALAAAASERLVIGTAIAVAFSPGPIARPEIPIYVAGVNRLIARMAGEVCDGFHVHPFHSRRYLEQVVRPAIADGAARAGRDPSDISLACPVFMIVGDSDEEIERSRRSTRRQLAFYGSTRTYRPVFEAHGWQDASGALHRVMAQGDVEAMEAVITDEMLDAYAVTASWDDLPQAILGRYNGLVDRVFPYFGDTAWQASPERRERWREVAWAVRSGGQ
jgi:probable F420-dependent oxidoreductase